MDTIAKVVTSIGYERIALIILVAGIFIDLNPGIKWNPIKSFFRYLGNEFNSSIKAEITDFKIEVNRKFEELQNEQKNQREVLHEVIREQNLKEIDQLSWQIIEFNNDILNNVVHSRDHYRHTLAAYDKYKNLIDNLEANDKKIIEGTVHKATIESGDNITDHYYNNKNNNVMAF